MPHRALRNAVSRYTDPDRVLQRIVDGLVTLLAAADGAMILVGEPSGLRIVAASGEHPGEVGRTLPYEASLAGHCLREGHGVCSDDLLHDARVDPCATMPGAPRSALAAPLRRDAVTVGVVCLFAGPVAAFTARDAATLSKVTGFAAVTIASFLDTSAAAHEALEVLGHPTVVRGADGSVVPATDDAAAATEFLAEIIAPGSVSEVRIRRRVQSVVDGRRLQAVLQPIVDLHSGALLGAESLARITDELERPPDVWFDEAHQSGLGLELEALAVRRALETLPDVPFPDLLAINITHDMLVSGQMIELLEGQPHDRIVVELTEHLAFRDYARTGAALAQLRARGVRLAVDDVGAGYSSFRHIVELVPEYIKLDRLFIDGIVHEPALQAMAGALVTFAAETGATLIAEGIETEAQLSVARRLGIRFGQGYLIARPGPSWRVSTRYDHVVGWPGRPLDEDPESLAVA